MVLIMNAYTDDIKSVAQPCICTHIYSGV